MVSDLTFPHDAAQRQHWGSSPTDGFFRVEPIACSVDRDDTTHYKERAEPRSSAVVLHRILFRTHKRISLEPPFDDWI
jgi:hypothetical protein